MTATEWQAASSKQQAAKNVGLIDILSSQKVIFNLIGLLKYAQSQKANSNSTIIKAGFTLVEIAIVIVIIGLIAGGIMVGKDLISAAEVRSQISQITKFNTAANTFKLKYTYLPGDITNPTSTAFGFISRGGVGSANYLSGDGVISGGGAGGSYSKNSHNQDNGEVLMFWNDLARAGLVEGPFSNNSSSISPDPDTNIGKYLPTAKLGNSMYVGVIPDSTSLAPYFFITYGYRIQSYNSGGGYFGIRNDASGTQVNSNKIPVSTAYNIDSKIDDGLPERGKVKAWWKYSTPAMPAYGTSSLSRLSTSCFDNNSVNGAIRTYSITLGEAKNCGLIFAFQ
jgi:prepilin-type N-terminal cleavage/methylation domain-containing protein